MMKHFLFLSMSVRCSIVSGESFEGDLMRMVSAFNLKRLPNRWQPVSTLFMQINNQCLISVTECMN